MASLYPAMEERRAYIKHRRPPRSFINTSIVHQCITVTQHLYLHLPNVTFPTTFLQPRNGTRTKAKRIPMGHYHSGRTAIRSTLLPRRPRNHHRGRVQAQRHMAQMAPWLLPPVRDPTLSIPSISPQLPINTNNHRVGVGRFTVPTSEDDSTPRVIIQHLFDGLALLHKFRMTDGRVYYMSRYTSNGITNQAKKDGYVKNSWVGPNPNTPLFEAQDPCSKLLGARVSLIVLYSMSCGSMRSDLETNGEEI